MHGLTSARWLSLDSAQRLTFYDALLERLPAGFLPERSVGMSGDTHPAVLHEQTVLRFVVVLGGDVEVGLTEARIARARSALAARWYDDADAASDVGLPTAPAPANGSSVAVAPFLITDTPAPFGVWRRLGLPDATLGAMTVPPSLADAAIERLEAHGLRLPTREEWEFLWWFSVDDPARPPLVHVHHQPTLCWDAQAHAPALVDPGPWYGLPQWSVGAPRRSVAIWPARSL